MNFFKKGDVIEFTKGTSYDGSLLKGKKATVINTFGAALKSACVCVEGEEIHAIYPKSWMKKVKNDGNKKKVPR